MNGLLYYNNFKTLNQWYKLFVSKIELYAKDSYLHWRNVEYFNFPKIKDECYKNISLEWLLGFDYVNNIVNNLTLTKCNSLSLNLNAYRLVFIDGFFIKSLSDYDTSFWDIEINNIYYFKSFFKNIQIDFFLHLIKSLNQQITRIYLKKNAKVFKPLYILHISSGVNIKNTLNMMQYIHFIDLEENSYGQVIEHFISFSKNQYFNGIKTSIYLNKNAFLNYTKLIFENNLSFNFSYNDIYTNDNARIFCNLFILSVGLIKCQFNISLNKKNVYLNFNSFILPFENSIIYVNTHLEHRNDNCLSYQLHKIILFNFCKVIFNGFIKIFKHTTKITSQIVKKFLLLNNYSKVITEPNLEIYSNNVKCNHGVSIGQVNKNFIFYLRSRGISLIDSFQIIIYSFVFETLNTVNNNIVFFIILSYISKFLSKGYYYNELSN